MPRIYKPLSDEIKKKISLSKAGTPSWNRGLVGYLKGKKLSQEWKDKIGRTNAIRSKGKIQSVETRIKRSLAMRGENNPSWKGGITDENLKIRRGIEVRLWRESVFARDNWTCQECGVRGDKLNADHIKPFSLFPELRTSIENGRTLCIKCHRKVTQEQHKNNLFINSVKTRFTSPIQAETPALTASSQANEI